MKIQDTGFNSKWMIAMAAVHWNKARFIPVIDVLVSSPLHSKPIDMISLSMVNANANKNSLHASALCVPLRVLILAHFVLVTWSTIGATPWLGLTFLFSNYFAILIGLWAERDTHNAEACKLFLFALAFTILNDIISMGLEWSGEDTRTSITGINRALFQWTAAMAIIHLLLKPVSCIFIFKELQNRAGTGQPLTTSGYEDLPGDYEPKGNTFPPSYSTAPSQPFP
jgi:hypothetical protein